MFRGPTDAGWFRTCKLHPRPKTSRGGTMSETEQQVRPGSEVHLDEWVTPEIADEHGYIRAGKILERMDVVGVRGAARHCRRPAGPASVGGLECETPLPGGERAALR